MTYPLAWIRGQFPALGTDTVFLDNAAGAQVPQGVIRRMTEALTQMQVNKGSAYRESQRITESKERVRAEIATFLGTTPRNVAFGANATTLIELLAGTWGRVLKPGDEVIVTGLDHHANIDPWRRLAERGVTVKTWQTTGEEARLELSDLEALLSERTSVVAMTAASNALGTLTPVAEAAALVHTAGAKLMVDAVHYAPHRLPDVQMLGADMLAFSPYKVCGPHLGVLYLSDEMLASLPAPDLAFMDRRAVITWEPGTQNHEAIHAFGGMFDYLDALAEKLGVAGSRREQWQGVFDAFHVHEKALVERLLRGLDALNVTRYGPLTSEGRTATVSLTIDGYSPRALAEQLAAHDIAVASGHYYAYDLMMKTLNLQAQGGAVRLSVLHYNSAEEIDRVLDTMAAL